MKIGAKMKVLENLEESQGKIAGTIKDPERVSVSMYISSYQLFLELLTKIYNMHLSVIPTSRQILKDSSDF